MTNVFLYGELRNKFGHEFKFNIDSAKEAFLAINANRKGFLDEIKKLAAKNVFYRIVIDDNVVQNIKELEITSPPKEIHILPVVWGAGKNGAAIGMLVVGIALTAVTMGAAAPALAAAMGMTTTAVTAAGATVTTLTAFGSAMASLGVGLALQGAMALLFPPPKPDFNQEVQAGGKSYLFGTKPSNTSQGQAVPVGYGRLLIGSSQVSASTNHHSLTDDIKQLMAVENQPISDYTKLEFDNRSSSTDGLSLESFSTNQSTMNLDEITVASASITNSYIDMITNSATAAVSPPVEVIVKRNGVIVSNPNLPDFDQDIEYRWQQKNQSVGGLIKIQNFNAFEDGAIYRSYRFPEFKLVSNLTNVTNLEREYFAFYNRFNIVRYGPKQFDDIPKPVWDYTYHYNTGEVVLFPTGNEEKTFFQAVASGIDKSPTGSNLETRTSHWIKILPPSNENLYRAARGTEFDKNFGFLPDTGDGQSEYSLGNPSWIKIEPISNTQDFENLLPTGAQLQSQGIYSGVIEQINENTILDTNSSIDNYVMEFFGYFYVPVIEDLKKTVPDSLFGVMYEILKVGDTGQWSGIGLTGANGSAIPPAVGCTFIRNGTPSNGDGIVYPVVKYNFKVDSDDASDLFIDGKLASSFYGDHGFSGIDKSPEEIARQDVLPSTSGEILLTAGHHQFYTRFQDNKGGEGISVYYQYDTNWDNSYSSFAPVENNRIKYKIAETELSANEKFSKLKNTISATQMIKGRQYKINTLGNTNWTQIGASSPIVGTVFIKNANTATGNGTVFEDFYNYTESVSAEANRIVRFVAERQKTNGVYDMGLTVTEADFECKVTLDGVTVQTSPVKLRMRFNPSTVNQTNNGVPS